MLVHSVYAWIIHFAAFVIRATVFGLEDCLVIYPSFAKRLHISSLIWFRSQFSIPRIPLEKNVRILPALKMSCMLKTTNFVASSGCKCFLFFSNLQSHLIWGFSSSIRKRSLKYLFWFLISECWIGDLEYIQNVGWRQCVVFKYCGKNT